MSPIWVVVAALFVWLVCLSRLNPRGDGDGHKKAKKKRTTIKKQRIKLHKKLQFIIEMIVVAFVVVVVFLAPCSIRS